MATNPVMLNDLRRSIFRRKPVLAFAIFAAAMAIVTCTLAEYIKVSQNPAVSRVPDLLLPMVAPLFTAGAFAKEHELGTWHDLVMTRLSNRQIVAGKLFAGLLPTCLTLLVLAPWM